MVMMTRIVMISLYLEVLGTIPQEERQPLLNFESRAGRQFIIFVVGLIQIIW